MKKYIAAALLGIVFLAGCGKHPVDEYTTVSPSETAYVVALDGDTAKNQSKMKSMDFLEANKVSAKRIMIPHKIVDNCPSCWNHDHEEDVPTVQVFKISRSPVTREWTSLADTGTSKSIQSFKVESVESIDFKIGATITAHIDEADTTKFLYYYSGLQLSQIIDTDVRGEIGTVLAREFGQRTYDAARKEKNQIFTIALKEARDAFAPRGITIDNLGYSEGMTPNDPKIQSAINAKFEADMAVGIADQQMQAAKKIAEASDAVKIKQDLEIRMKQVDIAQTMANRWNGQGIMPQFLVTNDGRISVNIPVEVNKK